jgi:asparagine synthase (glutamine-hydrolysing)
VFRYVAFVWDDFDLAARERAELLAQRMRDVSPDWQLQVDARGARVYGAGVRPGASEPRLLHTGRGVCKGVVLGTLFQRDEGSPSTRAPLVFSEDESLKILTSGGRRLVSGYWGRYVAVLHDEGSRTTRVLRDPTGGFPCFATEMGGVHVYFSRMEDVSQLDGHSFSVNWKYVAAMLCLTQIQIQSTGLNEVSRVLGGECVEHRGGHMSRGFYWNPLEIAQSGEVIDDPGKAAEALRAATHDCVHAWASSYPSLVHLLSGGLDSSIILASLKQAPSRPKMACLNYYSSGSNTDERHYARLAAEGSGCEVIERERNSLLSLEPLLRIRPSPIPTDYFGYLDEGRCEAQVAREQGARAIFWGHGGDQLFYRTDAWLGATDFLMSQGASPALFEVALDAARMDRTSVWRVLGRAVGHYVTRRPWSPTTEFVPRRKTILRQEVVHDISRDSDLVHPWLLAPGRAPNGKIFHAWQLLFPAEYYNPLGSESDPEQVTPLFSQPLLELAMRIPTWLLTLGGWDRAMARRAFEQDLPRRIVTRQTKGGQEEHAKSILVRNITFARELLLDGHLVREQLVERDQLAEALTPGPAQLRSGNAELYDCLSAEAWARKWCSQ